MKITNRQLLSSAAALTALGQAPALPVKPLFAVKRAISRCRLALTDLQDTATPINERFTKMNGDGKPEMNGNGQPIISDPRAYGEAMDILLAQEIELDIKPISAKSLGDVTTVTPVQLADLDWLIEDDLEP